MSQLERLHAAHASAVLDFEISNRDYFAATISDRGDEFFERFDDDFAALLVRQSSGEGAYYVVVDDDGRVIGRFNLYFVGDGVANLGYRIARRAAGRGLATATVHDLCRVASSDHGLTRLRAAVSDANIASQRVVLNNGFTRVATADPSELGGKPGAWFERELDVAST